MFLSFALQAFYKLVHLCSTSCVAGVVVVAVVVVVVVIVDVVVAVSVNSSYSFADPRAPVPLQIWQ